jgi:hypothetical protein
MENTQLYWCSAWIVLQINILIETCLNYSNTGGGTAQKHLSSKHETLSSNPSTAKEENQTY